MAKSKKQVEAEEAAAAAEAEAAKAEAEAAESEEPEAEEVEAGVVAFTITAAGTNPVKVSFGRKLFTFPVGKLIKVNEADAKGVFSVLDGAGIAYVAD